MLTELQNTALKTISEGHNILLTGQAGTGKSFVLHAAFKTLSNTGKRVVILCTTGMACLQYLDCRCNTVHSWAGLLDGRYDNLTLTKMVKEDDKMCKIRKNVMETDVLLIDEISMLSKKDFEQLELVCRTILNAHKNFGGIQVVASGDFYQLQPVGNLLYGDSGQFCFESEIWKSYFVHRINFEDVVRQSELDLIKAVSETARGSVSNDTDTFLKSLQRDLDDTYDPVHLFATNYDARIYNDEKLQDLISEGKVYEAVKNKGSVKHLKRILAPLFLHVKIGCLVVLLRNLGGKLMNGIRGHVIGFSENEIKVEFEIINQVHSIKRYSFTVLDMESQEIIAEREQFPLCLAYGLTIHKSQGMTLESVCIHCQGIFESGQMSVALGRGTKSAGIQLMNYRKSLCFQPKPVVTQFYRSPSVPFEDSLACCKMSKSVCIPDINLCFYDSDDSDFDERDVEAIDTLEEINEKNTCTNQDEEFQLPDFVNLDEIKNSVAIENPYNEKQKQITSICSSVSDIQLKTFLHANFKHLQTFLSSCKTPTSPKLWTEVLSKYHKYISNVNFKQTVAVLYTDSCLSDNHFYVASKFIYKLLQIAVHSIANEVSKEPDHSTMRAESISKAGKAKLRYVGGMCIAKAKGHYCGLIENNLGSEKEDAIETVKTNTEKVLLLRSLQAELDEIDMNDKTFTEIERCQNIRNGLIYINDRCYQFFIAVDSMIRSILNEKKLKYEKGNLFQIAKSEILKDKELNMEWGKLTFGINSEISFSVFQNVISRFLMVSQKQFLRDMKDMLSLKKKMAHREEIRKKQEKRKVDVDLSFEDIIEDNSQQKIYSHLRLKCNCTANKEFFMYSAFRKEQLLTLSNAYNVQCSTSCKKEGIANMLVEAILKVNEIPNPEALERSVSTSKRQRTRTNSVPSKGKGKGKGKSNNEKKYYCGTCKKEYNDNEDWVQCCSCNLWFDRSCAGLKDEKGWETILDEDVDWECKDCRA